MKNYKNYVLSKVRYIKHRVSKDHDLIAELSSYIKDNHLEAFNKWNYGDVYLYDIFRTAFEEKLTKVKDFDEKLRKFKKLQAEVDENCPRSNDTHSFTESSYQAELKEKFVVPHLAANADEYCFELVRDSHDFMKILRDSVIDKLGDVNVRIKNDQDDSETFTEDS